MLTLGMLSVDPTGIGVASRGSQGIRAWGWENARVVVAGASNEAVEMESERFPWAG